MSGPVSVQRVGAIAVITIDNPPVNALTGAVLADLDAAVSREGNAAETAAIVLAARGRTFGGKADPQTEEDEGPRLADVCTRIEKCEKPVIIALHGRILSESLELALSAHYRFADRRAKFGFPNVLRGLSPRAGGSQRLPRLVGAARAADLLVSGKPVGADVAARIGLVDRIAEGPLPGFTLRFVTAGLKAGTLPVRPTRKIVENIRPSKTHLKALEARRLKVPDGPIPAPLKIIECLEASILLPFEAGVSFERAVFEDLVGSPPARALAHLVEAERRTLMPPVPPTAKPRRLRSVGVVGAGLIGSGVAAACLDAGYPVTMVDASVERLETGVETVIDIFDRKVARGLLSQSARDQRIARLNGQAGMASLAGADLVIEATEERAEVKRRVFSQADAILGREAIIATTSSSVDVDGLAAGTGRPDKVVGLHFLPPAHVIRLCEVVIAVDTSDEVIATAFEFVRGLGKLPVAVGVDEGYIALRVQAALLHAAERTVASGASIEAVDAALREYGFPVGPFEMADLAGVDLAAARGARFRNESATLADRLLEVGRAGRRHGRGYHTYGSNGKRGAADQELEDLVAAWRGSREAAAGPVGPEEIRRRCLSAMANEGARLVEEGIALRPSDVDIAMVSGFGFPRYRGGPMMAADLTGLLRVKRDLDGFADPEGGAQEKFWRPAALFSELIKNGRTFSEVIGT